MLLLVVIGTVLIARNNLGYEELHRDEAVQFWLSQGIVAVHSIEQRPADNLGSVIETNRGTNLDPGGYGVLLHYVTRISKEPWALRSLSYVFFMITLVGIAVIAWKVSGIPSFSIAAPAVVFAYDQVLFFSVSIRAYSMEVAGTVLVAWALIGFTRNQNYRNGLLLGSICGIFLFSRYSFLLVSLAACITAAVSLSQHRHLDRNRRMLLNASYLAPWAACAIAVFFMSLKAHLAKSGLSTGEFGIRGDYFARTLRGLDEGALSGLLLDNLVVFPSLALTIGSLIGLVFAVNRIRHNGNEVGPGKLALLKEDSHWIFFFVLVCVALTVLASILGLHPWKMTSRFNLYLHALSLVTTITLLGFLVSAGSRFVNTGQKGSAWVIPCYGSVVVFAVAILAWKASNYRHELGNDLILPTLRTLHAKFPDLEHGNVVITSWYRPRLSYYYGYGEFSHIPGFPGFFQILENSPGIADVFDRGSVRFVVGGGSIDYAEKLGLNVQGTIDVSQSIPARSFFSDEHGYPQVGLGLQRKLAPVVLVGD